MARTRVRRVTLDTPIEYSGLSGRATGPLLRRGLRHLSDLQHMRMAEVLKVPGIGFFVYEEIRAKMIAAGADAWRGEDYDRPAHARARLSADEPLVVSRARSRTKTAQDQVHASAPWAKRGVSVVYVIRCAATGLCKIGTTTNLRTRLTGLMNVAPTALKLETACRGTSIQERALHARFDSCRMHGEWFALSDADAEWLRAWCVGQPGKTVTTKDDA